MEKYFGHAMENEEQILEAGKALLAKGVNTVIISLSSEGAYFLTREHILYSAAVKVAPHSTVGAGDAMVAAFAYGVDQGYGMKECAELAMAVSAGAVATIGTKPPKIKDILRLKMEVCVEKRQW